MPSNNVLANGQKLHPGESIFSPDGNTEFRCQTDGKVAVYRDGECVWQNTAEQRDDINAVVMQEDGNLVLYDNDDNPVWATNTDGKGSTTILVVQDDGNVVLYQGTPVWATNT
ncbi:hypothetical protein VTH06DRAFT_7036 [Thermothelomyces fergusii]